MHSPPTAHTRAQARILKPRARESVSRLDVCGILGIQRHCWQTVMHLCWTVAALNCVLVAQLALAVQAPAFD